MSKLPLRLLLLSLLFPVFTTHADNIIRLSAPVIKAVHPISPGERETYSKIEYSDWVVSDTVCGNYSPDESTISSGTVFTQTRSCSVSETRTGVRWTHYRDTDERFNPIAVEPESRTREAQETRQSTGTEIETGCRHSYNQSTPNYYWNSSNSGVTYQLYWNGQLIASRSNAPSVVTSLSVGGFTYTRGATTYQTGTNQYNIRTRTQICRQLN